MKIILLADALDNQRAGVHVYLRELVNTLASMNSKHEFILIRQQKDPDLPLRQIIVPTRSIPGFASWRLFVRIPLLLRKLQPDVVFEPAHFGPFNLPEEILRVTMIHDLTPILFPKLHRWPGQLLQQIFLPGIVRRADLLLANSHNTARDLQRVYPVTKDKTQVIHLGINPSLRPDEGKDFCREYQINAPYFLYVGTIEPRKNLDLLLEAYSHFRTAKNERILLVIVGQWGWKTEGFKKTLDAHPFRNDIILTGYIPAKMLPQAYTNALALIYPSGYEGFGFPVAEAMACGTNVICPNNSSLPEVGGVLAYYYPTKDSSALADQMMAVYRGGEAVIQRAHEGPDWVKQFSWPKYAQRFVKVLEAASNAP